MMEIAFGSVISSCALKALVFGLLFALTFPMAEARLAPDRNFSGRQRRIGIGLMSGSLFGLLDLYAQMAGDGFPPRIIVSAAVVLAFLAVIGGTIINRYPPLARAVANSANGASRGN